VVPWQEPSKSRSVERVRGCCPRRLTKGASLAALACPEGLQCPMNRSRQDQGGPLAGMLEELDTRPPESGATPDWSGSSGSPRRPRASLRAPSSRG